jgi:hypothetical protein
MLVEHLQIRTNEVSSDLGMAINTNNDISTRKRDGAIKSRGDNPLRIVEEPHERMFPGEFLQDSPRSIGGHTVCNDHLESTLRFLLREHGRETSFNVVALIPAGDNNGNGGS